MASFNTITDRLLSKNIQSMSGDSDETSLIVWCNIDKLKEALKGLSYQLLPNAGYDGGHIILPKDE